VKLNHIAVQYRVPISNEETKTHEKSDRTLHTFSPPHELGESSSGYNNPAAVSDDSSLHK